MSLERLDLSLAELESLFVNNPDLDRISAYLNRFNPIRIMRTQGSEIRHSNILAWLLDPLETHGLGDRFVKAFLSEALRGDAFKGKPTAIDVTQADMQDIEVRREWQHIDIFLLSRRSNWAFIVENKFHASQSNEQLVSYVNKVRSAFEAEEGSIDIKGIFLTLHDEEPNDPSYSTIGYDSVCDLLSRTIEAEGQSLGQEVRIFLEHYIEVTREAAGMSTEQMEMEQLARSLYRQHKKALDFVKEHGAKTNFAFGLDDVFKQDWEKEEFVTLERNSFLNLSKGGGGDRFIFLPIEWYNALGDSAYKWPGCEKWWSGYPVICWLELFQGGKGAEGTLRIFAEVGPLSDYDTRKKLIEGIKERAALANLGKKIVFQRTAANQGKKYSKFLKDNSVEIKDVQNFEEIGGAISLLLKRFRLCFDAVTPVLAATAENQRNKSNS